MVFNSDPSSGAMQSTSFTLIASTLALFTVSCEAHGRLVLPVSRGGTGYEDDPVPGLGSESFVCRHATKKPEVPVRSAARNIVSDVQLKRKPNAAVWAVSV